MRGLFAGHRLPPQSQPSMWQALSQQTSLLLSQNKNVTILLSKSSQIAIVRRKMDLLRQHRQVYAAEGRVMKIQKRLIGLGIGVTALVVPGLLVGVPSSVSAKALALTQIIFVSNRGGIINGTPNGNDIYTMNADGTNVQRLTTNTSSEYEPQWNPAGTRIAFTTNRDSTTGWDGNWEVYSMDSAGGGCAESDAERRLRLWRNMVE